MNIVNSPAAALLIIGDFVAYLVSLVLTLTIRYGQIPSTGLVAVHLVPFSILFIIFILVNFSAGLYDKQTSFIRDSGFSLILKAQLVNIILGIAFFYFAPVVIAPKANLFIYFIISTLMLLVWRLVMFPVLRTTRNHPALLVGSSADLKDLHDEVNSNSRYGIYFKHQIEPQISADELKKELAAYVEKNRISALVVDLHNPIVEASIPFFYTLVFSGIQVIDASKLYETIFDRIPLSLVGERWLVENAASSLGGRKVYDSLKRLMDLAIGLSGLLFTVIFYPIVWVAQKIEDGGPLFVKQERIGRNGKPIYIVKFRSMTADDGGAYKNGRSSLRVTKLGRIIRRTRIDELPQFWNMVKGDLSFIGPRPELPALVSVYEKEIPYYNVRHLIKPGLSGWAQISHNAHPHHAVAVDNTRDKLSYDLYYIKNRSFGLDIRILFQTVKSVLSKQGV